MGEMPPVKLLVAELSRESNQPVNMYGVAIDGHPFSIRPLSEALTARKSQEVRNLGSSGM